MQVGIGLFANQNSFQNYKKFMNRKLSKQPKSLMTFQKKEPSVGFYYKDFGESKFKPHKGIVVKAEKGGWEE